MENPIIDPSIKNSYEEAKEKAELLYAKLDRVWCPVLNEYVIFNRSGFQHLIWKGGLPRPKSEQKRRFALLEHAEKILSNPNATFSHEQKGNTQFWAFTEKQSDVAVRVVIRQVGIGKKHFLSTFEEK